MIQISRINYDFFAKYNFNDQTKYFHHMIHQQVHLLYFNFFDSSNSIRAQKELKTKSKLELKNLEICKLFIE